ncbi:hypothetical protein BJF79_13035 [Actinomadura sp. CNU-125]|uniref:hypothetical protein n=1 Tax=Actinomadura sp. CNU-125 TaxID=1904961 RepID=UPI00095DC29B|nr:hypothetical protein [Actinomadura sp. CNU-125]OLT25083.1 hypothetical protein BJF79_13035 [Actinomadura sp. CNU-125]
MPMRRPSFLPSLDELEQQAQDRSAHRAAPGSQFDHPTAKYVLIAVLAVTALAHIIGGIVFAIVGF